MNKDTIHRVKLENIRLDGGTQMRVELNASTVDRYADDMRDGDIFPPAIVMHDGSEFWLVDGFHRYFACKKNGYLDILCDVRTGQLIDAIALALVSNLDAGRLGRRPADKRRYVLTALEKMPKWSERMIAEKCKVSNGLVNKIRNEQVLTVSTSIEPAEPEKHTGKDGKQYPAKGKKKAKAPEAKPLPAEPVALPPQRAMPADATPGDVEPLAGMTEPKAAATSGTVDQATEKEPPVQVKEKEPEPEKKKPTKIVCDVAMHYAEMAIIQLENIQRYDIYRKAAGELIIDWVTTHLLADRKAKPAMSETPDQSYALDCVTEAIQKLERIIKFHSSKFDPNRAEAKARILEWVNETM